MIFLVCPLFLRLLRNARVVCARGMQLKLSRVRWFAVPMRTVVCHIQLAPIQTPIRIKAHQCADNRFFRASRLAEVLGQKFHLSFAINKSSKKA